MKSFTIMRAISGFKRQRINSSPYEKLDNNACYIWLQNASAALVPISASILKTKALSPIHMYVVFVVRRYG